MSRAARAPSDPPLQRLALPCGEAVFTDEGEGPAVVCLHGLPGGVHDFRHLAGPIAASHRVVRLALPGFSGSPASLSGTTTGEQVAFVWRALDALGVETATVLGHSFGGLLATLVAAERPDRVERLALLAPAGLRPHRAVRRTPAPKRLAALVEHPGVAWWLRPIAPSALAWIGFKRVSYDEFVRTLQILGDWSWAGLAARVAQVRAPSFVAWCADDPVVEGAVVRELASALPPGPRLWLDRGGHVLVKTRCGEILDALLPWLDEGRPPPPAMR